MDERRDWRAGEGDINLSPARSQYVGEHVGATASELLELDQTYFLHQSLSTPCLDVVEGCEGPYLLTADGRKILDFHGNNVHQVGFGHPHVVSAVIQQLGSLSFSTRRYTNRPIIELASRLCNLAPPGLNRVLFAPAASLAMGMALKLARLATGKYKTISAWGAFHGASLDAISVGGEQAFRRGLGPLLPGAEHVPPCNPSECPLHCGSCTGRCADYIEYVLRRDGEIGAVVLETIRNTDVIIPPKTYLERVSELCKRYGALLILDETALAFGRTGTMFAFEHYGIEPDMVVVGKGLGGGVMPIAGLIANEKLNVAGDTSIGHYTHEKSPLGAAAALAMLDVIEDERLCQRASAIGERMGAHLRDLAARLPVIRAVRGIGALWGIELDTVPGDELPERVMYEALARGLNFKVSSGNVLTLSPALVTPFAELDRALQMIEGVLSDERSIHVGEDPQLSSRSR